VLSSTTAPTTTSSHSLIDKEIKSLDARKYFQEVDLNDIRMFEQQIGENKEDEEKKFSDLSKELLGEEEDYYLCEANLDSSQNSSEWTEKEDEEGYILIENRKE